MSVVSRMDFPALLATFQSGKIAFSKYLNLDGKKFSWTPVTLQYSSSLFIGHFGLTHFGLTHRT